MNAELKWAIQVVFAVASLLALFETGRKRGWI